MSKKCKAYSVSKLGLAAPDNRKAFYAGWDAAIEQALTPGEPEYDKTELNAFVQDLYDSKRLEGKHGHYETLFHCVHQAIKRVCGEPEKRDLLYATVAMQEREAQRIENIVGTLEQIKQEKLALLAAAPQPQREWVSLTDEEINEAYGDARVKWGHIPHDDVARIARAIEAKLREKNGGGV